MHDGSDLLIRLVIMCVFGGVCAAIANSKGRNPVGWFFVGLLLGCIGLIIILCLSNENEARENLRVQDDVNRRLREQLRQEQMKVEALRAHTAARLDAHDAALGVNTRSAAPALGGSAPPMLEGGGTPSLMPEPLTPADDGTAWYYADEQRNPHGPMSIIGLRTAITSRQVKQDTLIWHEGLAEWTPAAHLDKLARFFT
jgi:hypothetical protein